MEPGERFNSYSHLAGLVLALAGAVLLLDRTIGGGDPARELAAIVFTLSMVALYAASALFHASRGAARLLWQRADHCAIYLLIAGTLTPFALVTLRGGWGWSLFCMVWALACWGMARELRAVRDAKPPLPLYIGMGWLAVIAALPLAAQLAAGGLVWLLAGALLYTGGTVFYRNRRGLRHAHGTWHLFVLGGSISHYVAIAGFVL